MPSLPNPFLYGNPVPPDHFFGRRASVQTVYSRMNNGESTAIVGEPHIGKSSLLGYVADEKIRQQNVATPLQLVFIEINCQAIGRQFTPADFWADVVGQIEGVCQLPALAKHLEVLRLSAYGSLTLDRFFRQLIRQSRRVVLLVDEFDVLLNHPNFNTAEFFGALRSIAIGSGGLALIVASRLGVAEMNRRTTEINPVGSPFFNNFVQERLYPLYKDEVDGLVDYMLRNSPIMFSREDRRFVRRVAGGHPFLIQAVSAALFQEIDGGRTGERRYTAASQRFYDSIAHHFSDLWRHFDSLAQAAMVLLALGEMEGKLQGRDFDLKDLQDFEWYEPELAKLREAGVVESETDREWTDNGAYFVRSGGIRWRVSAASFLWWVALDLLPKTRKGPEFAQWIHDREYEGLFTNQTKDRLLAIGTKVPQEFKELSWALIRTFVSTSLGLPVKPIG